MGNRPCAALCYDIDHRKSIHESTKIVNKSSALWAKQLSADFDDEYEPSPHNQRTNYNESGVLATKSSSKPLHPSPKPLDSQRIPQQQSQQQQPSVKSGKASSSSNRPSLLQPQHPSSSTNDSQHPAAVGSYYYSGFPADCRSMSSDTCGREARSEHDLSRRSSNATCEREDMCDEVSTNRSTS